MKKATLLLAWALPVLGSDVRLQALKDLDGYFPFRAADTVAAWEARKTLVRRQILVAEGLWPMPTKTPLNAVVERKNGRIVAPVVVRSQTGKVLRPRDTLLVKL